jgi:hypothetical protein
MTPLETQACLMTEVLRMNKLTINLEYCHGITKLKETFDFSKKNKNAYAIYAPNGSMKTSFATTFEELSKGEQPKDSLYPNRKSVYEVKDENNQALVKENIVVLTPYEKPLEDLTSSEILLGKRELRMEYNKLISDAETARKALFKEIKTNSGLKTGLEEEFASVFTGASSEEDIYTALGRLQKEVSSQADAPFEKVPYETVFNDKVLAFFKEDDVKTALDSFLARYNELISNSMYFQRGTFEYFQAETVAKNLKEQGFFKAKHFVTLSGKEPREIKSQQDLVSVIAEERTKITDDGALRAKFDRIERLLTANKEMKEFRQYILSNEAILSQMVSITKFKQEVWKSYLRSHVLLYNDVVEKRDKAEKGVLDIVERAKTEITEWDDVLTTFRDRFVVPYKVGVRNKFDATIGRETPVLTFAYENLGEKTLIDRNQLLDVLSQGERKALYILDILFDVQVRIGKDQETLFVVDDIADSFDYRNKYAIIQYLMDISRNQKFKMIILTHNFDFFRTVCSRFVGHDRCFMASRDDATGLITLEAPIGVVNVFLNVLKEKFFTDAKKRIASISFMRSLVEHLRSEKNSDFIELTSLLHWKPTTASITQKQLDDTYKKIFADQSGQSWKDANEKVVEMIEREAKACLKPGTEINFEHKVVLAIATRFTAERFMISKISDDVWVAAITKNLTSSLFEKFKDKFPTDAKAIKILQDVLLMTPENIHMNAFMYEPIIDMSGDHLTRLYREVSELK